MGYVWSSNERLSVWGGRQNKVDDGEAEVVGGLDEDFGTSDDHIRFVTVQF